VPAWVQKQISQEAEFYVIDGYEVAKETGTGRPHQHHHADVFLRHQRSAAARGSL